MTKKEMLAKVYPELRVPLFNYCLKRLKHVDSAQEAVQKVFLKALANETQFRDMTHCRNSIFVACRNECTDRIRSSERRVKAYQRFQEERLIRSEVHEETALEKYGRKERHRFFHLTVLPILKKACKKNGVPLSIVIDPERKALANYARSNSVPYSTIRCRYVRILQQVREQLEKSAGDGR